MPADQLSMPRDTDAKIQAAEVLAGQLDRVQS